MLPDPVSNPGPLTYESGALPIALRGPAAQKETPSKTPPPHHVWLLIQSRLTALLTSLIARR